jgi:hypothetical protein
VTASKASSPASGSRTAARQRPARRPAAGRPPARPKLYGSTEPRVWTKPLRKLEPRSAATEKRTLGYAVIDFASDVLELDLLPWQKWLLVHALELLPDGTFRFRTVIVLVARQNGKSTLSVVLALFWMYVLGMPLVIGTAQDLDVAEEIWQTAVDMAEETDDMAEMIERVVKVNGKKTLELKTGERYKVKAANRRAGRSLSGDLILLDELREHQSWEAWGAITKTTIARAMAMIWALSNAGDASSVVLRFLRVMAHLELGNPDGLEADVEQPDLDDDDVEDGLTPGLFEWSAPPGTSTSDRDGWALANPALGYTVTERAIASAQRTDPEWVFRTEVMCQWSNTTLEGPFPDNAWQDCLDVESKRAPGASVAVGVDVSVDRTMTHLSVCAAREDGLPHGEVIAARAGTDWVKPYLIERRDRVEDPLAITGVALQGKGAPVSALADDLEVDELVDNPDGTTTLVKGLPVLRWEGAELTAGTGAFYDAVCRHEFRHLEQPVLDVAAATAATKPLGESWVWNRRASPVDIASLVSVTAAHWAWVNAKPPIETAYADHGLEVV